MPKQEYQAAALPYAEFGEPSGLPDWSDLNVLLSVIRSGSLNKAAQALKLTQSTVSRHIDRLEKSLGVKVVRRTSAGASLTREGASIVEELNVVRDQISRIISRVKNPVAAKTEVVKFVSTDGVASYWLPKFLPYFFAQADHIELRVNTANTAGADKNENYDISIHYMQPNDPRARLVRLGTFHFVPYASPSYLQKYGVPKTVRDLAHYRLLDHAFYLIDKGTWKTRLPHIVENPTVELFTNSSTVLLESIRSGLGIAFLPTYVSLFEHDLVAVDVGLHYATPVFLCWTEEAAQRFGCRAVIHFLRHIFDKKEMPWLKDEYISPNEFPVTSVSEIGSKFSLGLRVASERQPLEYDASQADPLPETSTLAYGLGRGE